jgi:hypothetical protein
MSGLPSMLPPTMDIPLTRAAESLPDHIRDGLVSYLRYGLPPGSFLEAVLANDLADACARADIENRYRLFDYVYVLHNYAPSDSWGSREKVRAWIEKGMALRREHAEATS